MYILRELSQPSNELRSNPIVVCSSSLTGGLHANKKIEIRSVQSWDISSLNLGVVNSSQMYCIPLCYSRVNCILRFPKHYQLWHFSQIWPRYGKTQESGVGRWLIYEPLAGFLLKTVLSGSYLISKVWIAVWSWIGYNQLERILMGKNGSVVRLN
jgi:hypothetical protein